ncbi:hypothetical protein KKB18_02820, partial [bacterium]|nr:hypothetical protein [bacterium]
RYPKYITLFKNFRNHILSRRKFNNDFKRDSEILYRAMKRGNCYIAHDKIADSTGFRFEGTNQIRRSFVIMGEEMSHTGRSSLLVTSPEKTLIKLVKDGELFKSCVDKNLEVKLQKPGVYRVEVFLEGKPWIYSNPIYVKN